MKKRIYTVGVVKKFIKESANEFKPKIGSDVESDNKKNNEKAIKDIEKETVKYDGGLTNDKPKNDKIGDNGDFNKTTLDVDFDNEPSKEYTDRVKAQVHGYPSVENEKEHTNESDESGADFEGNEEIYDDIKDRNKEVTKQTQDIKRAGLKAREMPKSQYDDNTVFENKEQNKSKMKKLNFKHTKFLSEKHMFSKIPDEYKVNGNKFIMKDAADNEYLIEWVVDEKNNINEANVISHSNKTQLMEDFNKINKLMNYKSSDYFVTTNSKTRLEENNKFGDFINDVRKKMSLKD